MRIAAGVIVASFAAVAAPVEYTCPSGERFSVEFRTSPAEAVVHVPGKPAITLPQVESASGARYSDGFTTFWNKGFEAMIASGTVNLAGCLESAAATFTGLFVYLADSAHFTDCATGRRYPVAMRDGYPELERRYLEKRAGPGEPLAVTVSGRILELPPIEGPAAVPSLVVERLIAAGPGRHCLDGKWILTTLAGSAVNAPRPVFIEFLAREKRAAGAAGCNRFGGQFEAEGSKFSFAGIAATKMFCPGRAMEIEDRFFQALGRTAAYRIAGGELILADAEERIVATFRRE